MAEDQNRVAQLSDEQIVDQLSDEQLVHQYSLVLEAITMAGRHMFRGADRDEREVLFLKARQALRNLTSNRRSRDDFPPPIGLTNRRSGEGWQKCNDGSWAWNPPGCLNSIPKAQ